MTDEELNAPSYLIVKRGYYYRPNEQGYTSSAIQAGRYTLTEAEKITHPNGVDGPRDGMTFIHEDEVNDEDWKAYTTLSAQLAEARDERNAMIHPDHVDGLIKLAEPMLYEALAAETDRADRAEQRVATLEAALSIANATLAAQIEADAGMDPEKFLEPVIYAAKEAREKALREAYEVVYKWWFDDGNALPQELILALIEEEEKSE